MSSVLLDDYVSEIAACSDADAVFAAFYREVKAEGFQNFMFVRFMPNGDHEVPFIELPEDFPPVYLGENFVESDPVVVSIKMRTRPFTWTDMMREQDWGKQARRVFGACGELGAKNGLTIPFHLPNGRCDFFSLSFRENGVINSRQLALINMKTYATWQRLNELQSLRETLVFPSNNASQHFPDGTPGEARLPAHSGTGISEEECRAIVAVDIAHRRYKAGLVKFNSELPAVLGKKLINRLIHRGLIFEEPDDEHWQYVFRPSPIARAHLNSCPAVPIHRADVCSRHLQREERPICD